MFIPQIDNEEYGEALSLAHAYNLDSDLVYQRQWRKSTVSIASIQDYLVRDRRNKSDRCEEMSKGGGGMTKKREREMKNCISFGVYPTMLDVSVCVWVSRGTAHLKCSTTPLLYFTHHFYQFVAHFHTLPS